MPSQIDEDIDLVVSNELIGLLVGKSTNGLPLIRPPLEPCRGSVLPIGIAVTEHLESISIVMLNGGGNKARDGMLPEIRGDVPDPKPPVDIAIVVMRAAEGLQGFAMTAVPFAMFFK